MEYFPKVKAFLNNYSLAYRIIVLYIVLSFFLPYFRPESKNIEAQSGVKISREDKQTSNLSKISEDLENLRAKSPLKVFILGMIVTVVLGAGILMNILLFIFYIINRNKRVKFREPEALFLNINIHDLLKGFMLFFFLQVIFFDIKTFLPWPQNNLWRGLFLIANTLGIYTLVICFFLNVLRKKNSELNSSLGLSFKKFWHNMGIGILGYITFIPYFFILVLITLLICKLGGVAPQPHPIVEIFKKEESQFILTYLAVFAMVIAPVMEELIFRGFIYKLIRQTKGVYLGIAVTSILFALLHFNLFQLVPIVGLGVMLNILYEKTNSLIPSCTFHIINNSVALILTDLIISG